MPTAVEVQASVEQLVADGDKLHLIVHGDATTTVTTENGPVDSVAKLLKGIRDGVYEDAVDAAEASIDDAKTTAITAVNAAATEAGLDTVVENIDALTAVSENISNIDTLVANLDAIQGAADVVSPVPVFLTTPRAITIADNRKTMFLAFNGPGRHCIQSMVVPLDGSSPFPAGTRIDFVCTGTAAINFVRPNGDVIAGLSGSYLGNVGDQGSLIKTDVTDEWVLFGRDLIERPTDAFDMPKVWIDPSDLSLMRQERTGASATTPVSVGDPVGSIKNRGTSGGWATATADDRRPILRQDATGRYYLEFDGINDFLVLDGVPIDFAKLNLYVGFKCLTAGYAKGIVSLAPFDTSGAGYNNAFTLQQVSTDTIPVDIGVQTGQSPNALQAALQGTQPERAHVVEWRKTANATPATLTFDGKTVSHLGSQGQPGLANVTALVSATVRVIISANPGNAGQQGAIQYGDNAIYGLVAHDEVLGDAQRAAIRAFAQSKTYPTPPVFPAINDLTQLEARRATLISEVFSGGTIPTTVGTFATDATPPVSGLSGAATYEKMTIPGYSGNVPRVITPTTPRTDVFAIWMPGHGGDGNMNGGRDFMIQPYITAGIPVVTVVLPNGPNDRFGGGPDNHIANKPTYDQWAGPVSIAINTMLTRYPGAKVIMAGISGGGWGTVLCSAVDKRITRSLQFVGSMPEDRYTNVDYEQYLTRITAGYYELYLLASAADTGARRHIQILHENDDAGFDRAAYSSQPPYAEGLAAKAAGLGGYFDLRWFNYSLHTLNVDSRATLLAELP